MSKRHNRRRIRSRNPRHFITGPSSDPPIPGLPPIPEDSCLFFDFSSVGPFASTSSSLPRSLLRTYTHSNELTVQHWQNRYIAWQKRNSAIQRGKDTPVTAHQIEEADQYRLFGGEPGDDLSLCSKMLDYYQGLDFIDT